MIEINAAWLASHPLPQPDENTDKNRRGRLLVCGGSVQVPGAIRLTGEAALRVGAGKVQLATVEPAALGLGIGFPEAAVFGLPANAKGEMSAAAGSSLVAKMDDCDALVLGPGTGPDVDAEAILRVVLARESKPVQVVVDAAMIGALSNLRNEMAWAAGQMVLTPHRGEMAVLMGCDEASLLPGHAREAAKLFRATIVLKGAQTVIAMPDGAMLHYAGGGPGLATGGSGDVLAGMIGGLLARGADLLSAAGWSVWLHGEAGRRLGQSVGPVGFLAHELLETIPGLMQCSGNFGA